MMELDEIKKQLNKKMATVQQDRSASQIASLLKKETISVIQKIKRSLFIELALSVLFTLGCIAIVVFNTAWIYKTYFGIFIFLGIAFIIILALLLKKVSGVNYNNNVKNNIASLIVILKSYVKRYLQLGTALVPICFGFAYWLSYNDPTKITKPFRWDVFGYMLAYLAVSGTAVYLFSKWYLQKIYSKYIKQLQDILEEVDAD